MIDVTVCFLVTVLRVAAGFESTEGLSFLQNEGNSYDWVMASVSGHHVHRELHTLY